MMVYKHSSLYRFLVQNTGIQKNCLALLLLNFLNFHVSSHLPWGSLQLIMSIS